jgi:hypothetical protein
MQEVGIIATQFRRGVNPYRREWLFLTMQMAAAAAAAAAAEAEAEAEAAAVAAAVESNVNLWIRFQNCNWINSLLDRDLLHQIRIGQVLLQNN